MVKKSRKSRRNSRSNILGYVLIVFAIIGLLTIVCIYAYYDQTRVVLDDNTLCPNTGAEGVVAVLVDTSEAFSDIQRDEISTYLKDIKNTVPRNHKLSIYSLTTDSVNPVQEEIAVCNPGRGEDANQLISNPRMIKQQWEENYSIKIDSITSKIVVEGQKDFSPIMEAIRQIGVLEFLGKDKALIEKKLIIFSDMMQHDDLYSHYKNIANYNALTMGKKLGLMAKLQGAEVQIYYLSSPDIALYQNKDHVEFWQAYFKYADGLLAVIQRISK